MPIPASAQDWHIGLVGYGEVGRILCEDLRAQGLRVSAYDRKLGGALQRPLLEHARAHGVELLDSHARLAATADFVISAVTGHGNSMCSSMPTPVMTCRWICLTSSGTLSSGPISGAIWWTVLGNWACSCR